MDMLGLSSTLCVYLLYVLTSGTWGKVKVTLPVIVHLRSDRDFYSRLLPGGRGRTPGDYTIRRYFSINSKLILLKTGDPHYILNAFCDTIFPLNAPVIVYINNPYYHDFNAAATEYFRGIIQFLGLPVITWDPEYFPTTQVQQESRTLHISPTIKHQAHAMMSILERYNWTDFSIISTTEPGHDDFIHTLKDYARDANAGHSQADISASKPRFRLLDVIILRDIYNETKSCDDLRRFLVADSRVMLLYSRRSQTYVIMECAEKLGMTGSEYMWILSMDAVPKTTKSWVNTRRLPYGLFGIWYNYGRHAMSEVLDTSAAIWMGALKTLTQGGQNWTDLVSPNFTCSDMTKGYWSPGASLYEALLNVSTYNKKRHKIEFNSAGQLRHPKLQIINLQRSSPTGARNWTVIGQWTRKGLTVDRITWPGETLGPPKGKPRRKFLLIATLEENPYVMYEDMPDSGSCGSHRVPCHVYPRVEGSKQRLSNETIAICCTGLSIDLLIKLSNALEFDYNLVEVYDGQWGAEVNNEWNGLVRVLLDKKADMVITSLKINPERNAAVDFSVPFLKTGITIIVSIREGAISPTAFLEPYDYPSWCLILVFSVHATGTSIFIFEWLSPYGLDRGKSLTKDHKFSLFRSLWLIWAMLFSAAVSTDTPRGISSRFLGNLWALFALVFLASYTANLAAFMITKEEYYDLSGIQDWRLQNPQAMKPPFKFGTIPNGSTETNIKSNAPEMYQYMKRYSRPTVKEGIKAVKRKQLHAFIYDATVLEYRAGADKGCRLITVGKWGAMTGYGVAFPRGSKWIDGVNNVILELTEAGEMERLQKFWLAGACHLNKKKGSHGGGFGQGAKSSTLGIRNFTSAFIFLAGGISLGALIMLMEHLYFRFGRHKLKKLDKHGCCSLISLSMGKSLTFQQSVTEAIDIHRRHRCRDRACHAQYWTVRHELDMALGKVDTLQNMLTDVRREKEVNCAWRFEAERQPEVNPCRAIIAHAEAEELHGDGRVETYSRRRQGNCNKRELSEAEKIKDELMKLLHDECERESVI